MYARTMIDQCARARVEEYLGYLSTLKAANSDIAHHNPCRLYVIRIMRSHNNNRILYDTC